MMLDFSDVTRNQVFINIPVNTGSTYKVGTPLILLDCFVTDFFLFQNNDIITLFQLLLVI